MATLRIITKFPIFTFLILFSIGKVSCFHYAPLLLVHRKIRHNSNVFAKIPVKYLSKSTFANIDQSLIEIKKTEKLNKAANVKFAKSLPSTDHKKPVKNITGDVKSKFLLGNGNEAISSQNLLESVKSAIPFVFNEKSEVEDILGVFDEEEDDNTFESTSNNDNSKLSMKPKSIEINEIYSRPLFDTISTDQSSWLSILLSPKLPKSLIDKIPNPEIRVDYFCLCLACHFSTVASYVPTDVDSKIRGHCWNDPDNEVLNAQLVALKSAMKWDPREVSAKTLQLSDLEEGNVLSGHNGEWLGVLAGALGAFVKRNDVIRASEVEDMIHIELQREAKIFDNILTEFLASASSSSGSGMTVSSELGTKLLQAASILTHNVGDVDQGISYWTDIPTTTTTTTSPADTPLATSKINDEYTRLRSRFAKLAHEGYDRYHGKYQIAKKIYKELVSAEGHRNYPLRESKVLRRHKELLLPLGPWLESWGREIAQHPILDIDDKAMIVRQLLRGCDSNSRAWCVPNQIGYYRALQGFDSVLSLDHLARSKAIDKECRELLKSHAIRSQLSISEEVFAQKLAKRAYDIISNL